MNVAGTRALLDPPAGLLTLVPGELPPLDFGCGLTPPEAEAELELLVVVVFGPGLVCVFVLVVGVLCLLVEVDVVDLVGAVGVVA